MSNLFQQGRFVLHSGEVSTFKIECDALTGDDWSTLAAMIAARQTFSSIAGVPRGGLRLAHYLDRYRSLHGPALIVDDVWTTGGSMLPYLDQHGFDIGYVVFARKPITDKRVRALFTLEA